MTKNLISIVTFLFLGIPLYVTHASAAHNETQVTQGDESEVHQCASLLRECFSYHGYNRSNCFFTTATHPFCEGSELGVLAYRRWVLSPSGPELVHDNSMHQGEAAALSGTTVQAFLGAQIVDRNCISQMDELLQSSLRIDQVANDTIRKLTTMLEGCRRDIGLELHRQ